KALEAIKSGKFKDEIVPFNVKQIYLDKNEKRKEKEFVVDTDEGPRADTNMEALAKLRPVFSQTGSVTAGNSSQTSDGAAFLMIMSEKLVKELGIEPIARLVGYAPAGVDPRIMGIGPVAAVPKVLQQTGLKLKDIEQFELNE